MYRQKHTFVPMVVCSRKADYLSQQKHIHLRCAIVVQPLTAEQIEEYLSYADQQLEVVRLLVYTDPMLRELVTSPLMLSVLTLAYAGKSIEDFQTIGTPTTKQQLFADYVKRMLQRRGGNIYYSPERTIGWLVWLAQQMKRQDQTEFYLERLQPDCLIKHQLLRNYITAIRLFKGIICGLGGGFTLAVAGGVVGTLLYPNPLNLIVFTNWLGIAFSLLFFDLFIVPCSGFVFGFITGIIKVLKTGSFSEFRNTLRKSVFITLSVMMLIWLVFLMVTGLVIPLVLNIGNVLLDVLGVGTAIGLIIGIFSKVKSEIEPSEIIVWSWKRVWQTVVRFLKYGIFLGFVGGLIGDIIGIHDTNSTLSTITTDKLMFGLCTGLIMGLGGGLSIGLINGLANGFSSEMLEKHNIAKPNEGIRRSVKNAAIVGVVNGLFSGLGIGILINAIFAIIYILRIFYDPDLVYFIYVAWLLFGLFGAFFSGLIIGPFSAIKKWFSHGGTACIQHIILRFFLWFTNATPLRYVRFLDYTVECVLLRKVGGGYMFVHQSLLEYFASQDTVLTPRETLQQIPVKQIKGHRSYQEKHTQDISSIPTQPL